MPLVCKRCGRTAESPEAKRVPFGKKLKERLLASVCADCWKEWEAVEVRVVNEYRLNFLRHKQSSAPQDFKSPQT